MGVLPPTPTSCESVKVPTDADRRRAAEKVDNVCERGLGTWRVPVQLLYIGHDYNGQGTPE